MPLNGAEFCKANHMARKGSDWTISTLAWDLLAQSRNPGAKLQQPLIFRSERSFAQGMRYIRRPTRREMVMRALHVKQSEGYTYMDQKGIHFRGIFFKPAVWIEPIAILAEKFRVAVEDPWIYTEDGLECSLVRCKYIKPPTLEMKVFEAEHYPFGKELVANCNSTRRSDSWIPHTNSGMEAICLFYLFGKVRSHMSQTGCDQHTQA